MYLKALFTASAAATLPASINAICNSDGKEGCLPNEAGDGPAIMTMSVPENTAAQPLAEGEVAILTALPVNTALPAEGQDNPNTDVAVTSTDTGSPILSSDKPEPVMYDSDLVGPTWSLVQYNNANTGELTDLVEGSYITIEFEEDGTFDGHSGCNRYSAGYTDPEVDSTFTVLGPMMSTLMICEDAVNQQEQAYTQIFDGDIKWIILDDGKSLTLSDADDDTVLAKYELYSPVILGTTWQATQFYDNSTKSLVDVPEGSTITFNMEVNEHLDGNAGCNDYIGQYDDLTATEFKIDGPIGSTKMLCEPQGVNDNEYQYLANFYEGREVEWVVLEDVSLELKDASTGDVFAKYEAGLDASEDPLDADTQDVKTQGSGASVVGAAISALAVAAAVSMLV